MWSAPEWAPPCDVLNCVALVRRLSLTADFIFTIRDDQPVVAGGSIQEIHSVDKLIIVGERQERGTQGLHAQGEGVSAVPFIKQLACAARPNRSLIRGLWPLLAVRWLARGGLGPYNRLPWIPSGCCRQHVAIP